MNALACNTKALGRQQHPPFVAAQFYFSPPERCPHGHSKGGNPFGSSPPTGERQSVVINKRDLFGFVNSFFEVLSTQIENVMFFANRKCQ